MVVGMVLVLVLVGAVVVVLLSAGMMVDQSKSSSMGGMIRCILLGMVGISSSSGLRFPWGVSLHGIGLGSVLE